MNQEFKILNQIKEQNTANIFSKDLPKDYFENFTTNLQEKINSQTFIDNLPKTNIYKTPINYFENFVVKPKSLKIKFINKHSKIAMAASIALLLSCIAFYNYLPLKTNSNTLDTTQINYNQELDKFTPQEIKDYLKENLEDVEADEMLLENISLPIENAEQNRNNKNINS